MFTSLLMFALGYFVAIVCPVPEAVKTAANKLKDTVVGWFTTK